LELDHNKKKVSRDRKNERREKEDIGKWYRIKFE